MIVFCVLVSSGCSNKTKESPGGLGDEFKSADML